MRLLILDIDYTLNMEDPRPLVEIAESQGLAKYGKEIWKIFEEPTKDMDKLPHPIPYKYYDVFTQSYDKVIIITSRLENWKRNTKRWLKKWEFWYDDLYMRPKGNYNTTSHDLKEELLTSIIEKYKPTQITAIDDDPGVVEFYRSQKIKTFVAPDEWEKALKYHKRINERLEER
jgi:hypothetical protein